MEKQIENKQDQELVKIKLANAAIEDELGHI